MLQRRAVEIAWQNGEESLISQGLAAGDELVTTPLGQVISGTRVRIAGQHADHPEEQASNLGNTAEAQ